MNLKGIHILGIAAVILLLASCHKKEEETEIEPYLDGVLSFSIPSYVLPSVKYTLVPSGASNPTTGNVGYCWSGSWDSVTDTTKTETGPGDGSWDVTMPSEIGVYTIYCRAFASGYSYLSAEKEICVIDPTVGVSLTGTSYQIDSVKLEDPRDGGIYYLATSGDKVWTQNNLYYEGSGVPYDYSTAIDPIFGRLYTWQEAVTACPEGWHLPSDAEFAALASSFVEGSSYKAGENFSGAAGALMADAYFLGSKMWAFWPDVKITDKSKFSAIPVGYAIDQESRQKYVGMNSYAVFWTSDDDGDAGIYRYIYVDKNNVFVAKGDKTSFRASVRCVKD
ncbi:MAG: hypothetical protein IK076_01285 [Bacteroidales bacterium]|nr:hypothetical protein [Bacteroidales bacterium]